MSPDILISYIKQSFKLTEAGMRWNLRLELRVRAIEKKRKAVAEGSEAQVAKRSALGTSN